MKGKKYPLDGPNQEWHAGYAAGLAAGQKKERRRVQRCLRRHIGIGPHWPMIYSGQLHYMLGLRKRAKRKG